MEFLIAVLWIVGWSFLGYRMAKSRNRNVVLWSGIGLLGPYSAIILLFVGKSNSNSGSASFAEQAADRIQTVRYSVDNISSKINESSHGQSVNKMKDIFRKR